MPEEFDNEQDPAAPHPAEQRIADRDARNAAEEVSAKAQLAVVDAGLNLDTEKRKALLAVVGDDLSADNLRAKAEQFGWYAPPSETPGGPSAEQLANDAAALRRTDQAAADSPPPPPPLAPIQSVMAKAQNVSNPAELAKLYGEAMQAINATPGLQFGSVEVTDGTFSPL